MVELVSGMYKTTMALAFPMERARTWQPQLMGEYLTMEEICEKYDDRRVTYSTTGPEAERAYIELEQRADRR